MSGPNQQVPVAVSPLGGAQGGIEVKEYKRSYFSGVVAMILAKARRECDCTDDITTAVANWHISSPPAAPANKNNPFQF